MNKYEPHTENGLILYLADNTTHNMIAWIPGRNTVATINKFTVIKASPSDFGFQPNNNIILSHIPDFIKSYRQPQEGDQSNDKTQNQKLCSISPSKKNGKNGNPSLPSFSPNSPSPLTNIQAAIDSNDLDNTSPAVIPTDSNNNESDYWQQPIDDDLLTISEDIPYLRQSTRNLRFHHPVQAVALKPPLGSV